MKDGNIMLNDQIRPGEHLDIAIEFEEKEVVEFCLKGVRISMTNIFHLGDYKWYKCNFIR